MRTIANLGLLLLLCGGQASAAAEMTDAERLQIVESVSLTADVMISLFDSEDPAYFDFYSDWAEEQAVSYPPLLELPEWIRETWWDGSDGREAEMGEINALVLGPDAVLLERTDVFSATLSDGSKLEERWVGRQLWRREAGEWNVLFEDFQMLGAEEIQ